MQKRQLGHDGPQVSAIGIGAMSFADFYGPTTKENSFNILRTALELGIDHIDTANVYGQGVSEQVIGEFLAGHKGASPFTIATKAAITRDADSGARIFDNSRAHLEAELDGSLKRMGLERVELFYVHRRDPCSMCTGAIHHGRSRRSPKPWPDWSDRGKSDDSDFRRLRHHRFAGPRRFIP
jgi:aryl-alcohol dehydrogenase-like predicted oxidoreductase